jgi:EAL domain-containing protein (putative c-di-GMP-specific phosphodiesterase class I)/CHASE2 domain-containing sensor protein
MIPVVTGLITIVCNARNVNEISMIWSINHLRSKSGGVRLRLLMWATLAGLLVGTFGVGQPLEDLLRNTRNLVRRHAPSGEIVIVAIDDQSLQQMRRWPWPRSNHAQLVDRLHALGAQRIFFDVDFSSSSDPEGDAAFQRALAMAPGKVTLPVQFVIDRATGSRTDNLPTEAFRHLVELATINFRYNYRGEVWKLPYSLEIGGASVPSFAAKLAGIESIPDGIFEIDFSIDPLQLPSVSAVEVINGNVTREQVAGKTLIVAATSSQLGDIYLLPGYGYMSGVYVHTLGAETLIAGSPASLGWITAFCLAVALSLAALRARSVKAGVRMLLGASALYLLAGIPLDSGLLFVDVVPSLVVMWIVGGTLAWKGFRHSYLLRGTVNAQSGLPNLSALRTQLVEHGNPLIVARIQNYPEIASTLSPEGEGLLARQIARRVTLGSSATRLFQGDEGIFAWFASEEMSDASADHLNALHDLFRSPVSVQGTSFDLSAAFGVDADAKRSVTNRLGSALVAADEALMQGLKWKQYDLAKQGDATWRLSLLSQLDRAIDRGDLWIAYQPKLDLTQNRILGAEALVRWTHDEKGEISPADFILAAEQGGRIQKLTTFVLGEAIAAAAEISAHGAPFNVAVNLSARLIDDMTLTATVADLLKKHALPAECLTLEVTETAALTGDGKNMETLHILRRMGVSLSIDDYGTGQSTLDYLKRIPACEVKIDKSFVQAIARSESDRVMVESTIQLAHSLGQRVVAEGVEDQRTQDLVAAMGCDLAQGFYIARPMRLERLKAHLMRAQNEAA